MKGAAYERVAARVAINANGKALCPAHPDRNPSLSVKRTDVGAALHCHAGCSTEAIVKAIGLTMVDLFDEPLRQSEPHVKTFYPYMDANGQTLYFKVRYQALNGKRFAFLHADGKTKGMPPDAPHVLYRWPEVNKAVANEQPVYVVEGEKDVDALTAEGLTATTGDGGADNWGNVAALATKVLAGARVVIIPDRDQAGERYAQEVAATLMPVAASVTVMRTRDGFKDASEHLGAGYTVAQLPVAASTDAVTYPNAQALSAWLDEASAQPTAVSKLGYLTGEEESGRFSQELWDARRLFAHVRQAALHRLVVSPEALLVTVLGHVTTHIPNAMYLPGPPRIQPVNLFVCVVGHPGSAKGSVLDAANHVLPPPLMAVRQTLGSAQGFAKSFYRPALDNDNKPTKVWERHRESVILRTDEISTYASLVAAKNAGGDLLAGELKKAFSGEELGFNYVTDGKSWPVEPLSYRVLCLFGVAPAIAAPLFSDAGGGMPDRFLFVTARAAAEATLAVPEDPKQYGWKPMRFDPGQPIFDIATSVATEMDTQMLEKARNGASTFEAHFNLQRLRIATAMAYVENRFAVTAEDYELAGYVTNAHRQTRDYVLREIEQARLQGSMTATRMAIVRAAALEDAHDNREEAKRQRRIIEGATKLARKVQAGAMLRTDAYREMKHYREVFDEMLDHCKAERWVMEDNAPSHTGNNSRMLEPGTVKLR